MMLGWYSRSLPVILFILTFKCHQCLSNEQIGDIDEKLHLKSTSVQLTKNEEKKILEKNKYDDSKYRQSGTEQESESETERITDSKTEREMKSDLSRESKDYARMIKQEVVLDVNLAGVVSGFEEPWEGEAPEHNDVTEGKVILEGGRVDVVSEPEPEPFENESTDQPKVLESVSLLKDVTRDILASEQAGSLQKPGILDNNFATKNQKVVAQGDKNEKIVEGEERRNKRKLNAVIENNPDELELGKNVIVDSVILDKLMQQQRQQQQKSEDKQQQKEQQIEQLLMQSNLNKQQQLKTEEHQQSQEKNQELHNLQLQQQLMYLKLHKQQQHEEKQQLYQGLPNTEVDQQQLYQSGKQSDIPADKFKNLKSSVNTKEQEQPDKTNQQKQQQDVKRPVLDGFQRITMSEYDHEILPQSHSHPFLFYAYTDFCEECNQAEVVWELFQADLAKIGLRGAALNIQLDSALARRLRVWGVPTVVVVMGGRVQAWYSKLPFCVDELRQFVLDLLLSTESVTRITDRNADEFLAGWSDNRVRMLLAGPVNQTTAQLLLAATAYAYRGRVATGYIITTLKDGSVSRLMSQLKLSQANYSMMIFNEDHAVGPSAQQSMNKLKLEPMRQLLEANLYLQLPRSSNQAIFDYLCPIEPSLSNKRLCVLLLTRKDPAYNGHLTTFRQYALNHQRSDGRVLFAYMYEDTQAYFTSTVTFKQGVVNTTANSLKVAVMWRNKERQLQYDLLTDGWIDDSFTKSDSSPIVRPTNGMLQRYSRRLTRTVDWLLETNDVLPYIMNLRHNLTDEHARSLPVRILYRLRSWSDRIFDKVLSVERGTYVTVFSSAILIAALGLAMHSMAASENAKINSKCKQRQIWSKPVEAGLSSSKLALDTSNSPIGDNYINQPLARPTVHIHPLTPDSFDALILKSEPGVRLILLLVDSATKDRLLQYFAQAMLPYCRSKAFQFSFLLLDDDSDIEEGRNQSNLDHLHGDGEGGRNTNLDWYRRLLEESVNTAAHAAVAAANAGPLAAIAARSTGGNAILRRRGFSSSAAVSAAAEVRKELAHINAKNCVGTVLAINGPRRYYAMYHVSSTMATVTNDNDDDEELDEDARKMFDCELLRGLPKWMENLCEASISKGAVLGGLAPGGLKKFRVNTWPILAASKTKSSKMGGLKKES